ncbi:hypothetical protein IT568_05280 [bacterium]|nr:hypothetical protein [bacterium]
MVDKIPMSSLDQNRGFSFQLSTIGLGFGGIWGKQLTGNIWLNSSVRLDVIQEDGDIPEDNFGNSVNNQSTILMLPLVAEMRWYPDFDALDRSVRPYLGLGAGPVLGWSFPQRDAIPETKNNFSYAFTVFGNVGFDYLYSNYSYFGMTLRYSFIEFQKPLFNQDKSYSNFALMVSFGRLLR